MYPLSKGLIFVWAFIYVPNFVCEHMSSLCICNKYSKTCLKRSLKKWTKKVLTTNDSLMKVESIANCSLGAFCYTFYLHLAVIGLITQFSVLLRVAVLHGFYWTKSIMPCL